MIKKLIFALLAGVVLTGCIRRDPTYTEVYGVDQEKRVELFNQCLERVPVGPTAVKYNDWDELVRSCDVISKSQAKKCIAN